MHKRNSNSLKTQLTYTAMVLRGKDGLLKNQLKKDNKCIQSQYEKWDTNLTDK